MSEGMHASLRAAAARLCHSARALARGTGRTTSALRSKLALPWGWTVPAIAAVDLAVRWRQAMVWQPYEWGLYAVSGVYALLWLRATQEGLSVLCAHARWAFWAAVAVLQGALTFMILVHFNHYTFFGVAPELLSFMDLFSAPDDTKRAIESALTPLNLVLLFGLTAGLACTWQAGPKPARRLKRFAARLGIAVLLTPVFWNNVPQGRGNFLPSVNFTFLAARAAHAFAYGERSHFLPFANRNKLPQLARRQPYNVLFILGESLRHASASYAGYTRDNTPHQRAFFARHPRQSFVFEHCYASSIRTNPSVPSIVSGVHPMEFPEKLLRTPLMYKYGKVFAGTRTFVLSAQSYSDYNYVDFFRSSLLDDLVYQENSGYPAFSWDGMDDGHLLPFLQRNLDAAAQGQADGGRFFGILHLNGTHDPFDFPKSFRKWTTGDKLDDYDNSILYQDYNLHLVLNELEQRGLLENTIVVFASDHGEAFGEHGRFGHAHGYPYEEMTHVAAWLYLPRDLAERFGAALRTNTARNVSNLDWVPTVVDLLGLAGEPEIQSITADLMGRSLLTPVVPQRILAVENNRDSAPTGDGFGLIRGTQQFLFHPSDGIQLFDIATGAESRKNLWPALSQAARHSWREATAAMPVVAEQVASAMALQEQRENPPHTAMARPAAR